MSADNAFKLAGRVCAAVCNVADMASVESARDAIRARFGDAQVLVNSAGIIRRRPAPPTAS